MVLVFFILALLLFVASIYGIWQSPVRISHVHIVGTDDSLAPLATRAMQGSYAHIIPRDSIFFFPASTIRAAILSAYPGIAAVSINRDGLTSITVTVSDRVPVARWCGSTYVPQATTTEANPPCYLFDANGFIYSAARIIATATTTASSSVSSFAPTSPSETPLNAFELFETLSASTTSPIGQTLPNASSLPVAFDFARKLGTFATSTERGSSVTDIVIHNGEVDDYLASGTRITYLLGDEQNAFTALVSAKNGLNLADGSVEYIDLRFSGKVYVKRVDNKQ